MGAFDRPQDFEDFIGQENVVDTLEVKIASAQKRGRPLDHLLLQGRPGLGKTTLAYIVTRQMGVQIKVTSGPALTKAGDLAAILTSLEEGDVLFIDEIHRLPKAVEEALYPAIEDLAFDVIVGKGPGARLLRLSLNPFTLMGATTRISLISKPLRSRFTSILRLSAYDLDEVAEILDLYAGRLSLELDSNAKKELATACRGVPRNALQLLRHLRDLSVVSQRKGAIDGALVKRALEGLGIDSYGLDPVDRLVLTALAKKGRALGLRTLSLLVGEEESALAEVNEPYLVQMGFLELTPKGRVVTSEGCAAVGLPPPDSPPSLL
ncbi:Holliday junction branch migration DNA helicase RuvB [bacterium]|nr:Holliday junction branch migration DNA helicase RuvB [bacterium]